LVFRFATGTRTGRPIQERPAHEFDHHRLQQCLFLWERALVFLSLLSPLLRRMPGRMRPLFQSAPGPHGTHALNGRRARILPSTLLLSSEFMRLQAQAGMAVRPNPGPTSELPLMPAGTLLVIARRHICGAFMHARTVEAGSCPLGRR